jgi:prophage endopeptidase
MIYTHVAAALVAAALAATGAWQVQAWRHEAKLATVKQGHAEVLRDIAKKTKDAADAVRTYETTVASVISAADTKHTKELSDAKKETDRYRACVRAGTCGVRIVTQAAPGRSDGSMPQDAGPGSVGDAAQRLDGEVSERVFDLRDAISDDGAKLRYLQAYAAQCARHGVEAAIK